MAIDSGTAVEPVARRPSLQAVFSTAIAGVTGVRDRLGLAVESSQTEPVDDPDRETWASISSDVCAVTENAAIATGLHHQAAAELDDIGREIASIRSLCLPDTP